MRIHKLFVLLAFSVVLLLANNGYALEYDFSGKLKDHNNVLRFSFTTNGTSNVTLFSSSWKKGNFDPMLGLWNSDGSLVAFQDDGHKIGKTISNGKNYDHGNWDFYLTKSLDPGTYIISLIASLNSPIVDTYGRYHLSNGFASYNQAPRQITARNRSESGSTTSSNNNLKDDYEFHILGADTAQAIVNPVPEPSTILLLGAGLAGLGLIRRRTKK